MGNQGDEPLHRDQFEHRSKPCRGSPWGRFAQHQARISQREEVGGEALETVVQAIFHAGMESQREAGTIEFRLQGIDSSAHFHRRKLVEAGDAVRCAVDLAKTEVSQGPRHVQRFVKRCRPVIKRREQVAVVVDHAHSSRPCPPGAPLNT